MFGYVVPQKSELKLREYDAYRAIYCGLCKQLKRSCGTLARVHLSFDMTFMALTGIISGCESHTFCMGRCALNPFLKRGVTSSRETEITAYVSVLLVYYKLKDDIADERRLKRLAARGSLLFYKRLYKKAAAALPETDVLMRERLLAIAKAEKKGGNTVDFISDIFAGILSHAFGLLSEGAADRRILSNIGYNTGKWIYIMDAAEDLKEDISKGRFNPFADMYRQEQGEALDEYDGRIKKKAARYLSDTRALICMAAELLNTHSCRGILENIIYLGMPAREKSVLGENNFIGEKDEGSI